MSSIYCSNVIISKCKRTETPSTSNLSSKINAVQNTEKIWFYGVPLLSFNKTMWEDPSIILKGRHPPPTSIFQVFSAIKRLKRN